MGRYAMDALARPLRLPDQPTRTQSLRIQTGRFLQRVVFDFGEPFSGMQNTPRLDEVNDIIELHTHGQGQSPRQEMSGELHLLTDTIPAAEWTAHRVALQDRHLPDARAHALPGRCHGPGAR